MANSARVEELLIRWEQLRSQGQLITATELCRGSPELCGEVDERIRALEAMNRALASQPSNHIPRGGDKELESDATLRPGAQIAPGYTLVKRLGRGGFGQVWEALGSGGFSVALKFVSLGERSGKAELRALDLMKNVRHPHLLALFGAGQFEGYLVIAMELAERTLMHRFEEATQQGLVGIPSPEILSYFTEAAEAIDFLNEPCHLLGEPQPVGIQHRDIKPQNLLILGGRVKVGDFGLARMLAGAITTHTGSMTLAYAAPEFFRNQTFRQSDQYCLAVSYCQMRGGRLPFTGTPEAIMAGHLHEPPDLEMLPKEERAAVARALAKNPKDRWPNCRALTDSLAERLRGPSQIPENSGVGAKGASTSSDSDGSKESQYPRITRARFKRRLMSIVIGFALLSLISVIIYIAPFQGESDKNVLTNPVKEAATNYYKGIEAYDRKDWTEAFRSLSESIRMDPTNTEAYFYRAMILTKKHEFEKALQDFGKISHGEAKYDVARLFMEKLSLLTTSPFNMSPLAPSC